MSRQAEPIITHFSHQHPLHLTNPQPFQICSCCKQTEQTEPFYTCKSPSCTTFSLHRKCSQLPLRITHPFHHHPLSLVPKTQNINGVFTCNGCGNNGDGFSYGCKECGVSVHVMCATLPLCLSHLSHCHRLDLVFMPPYGTNGPFSCDMCGVIEGRKCWLYRCGSCGFDAHLSCATSKTQMAVEAGRAVDPQNLFLNQIGNQRNDNVHGLMGYGGGGNVTNQLLQAMMGGGGGNNVTNQLLQAMMGGGGGGSGNVNNQILQRIMSGGSGGGDLIQGLLNGSNGGGLDLSSVLGNVGDFGGLMDGGFGGFGF